MANQTQSNITGVLLSLGGFALYSTHDVVVKLLGGFYTPFQILFFSVLFLFRWCYCLYLVTQEQVVFGRIIQPR